MELDFWVSQAASRGLFCAMAVPNQDTLSAASSFSCSALCFQVRRTFCLELNSDSRFGAIFRGNAMARGRYVVP